MNTATTAGTNLSWVDQYISPIFNPANSDAYDKAQNLIKKTLPRTETPKTWWQNLDSFQRQYISNPVKNLFGQQTEAPFSPLPQTPTESIKAFEERIPKALTKTSIAEKNLSKVLEGTQAHADDFHFNSVFGESNAVKITPKNWREAFAFLKRGEFTPESISKLQTKAEKNPAAKYLVNKLKIPANFSSLPFNEQKAIFFELGELRKQSPANLMKNAVNFLSKPLVKMERVAAVAGRIENGGSLNPLSWFQRAGHWAVSNTFDKFLGTNWADDHIGLPNRYQELTQISTGANTLNEARKALTNSSEGIGSALKIAGSGLKNVLFTKTNIIGSLIGATLAIPEAMKLLAQDKKLEALYAVGKPIGIGILTGGLSVLLAGALTISAPAWLVGLGVAIVAGGIASLAWGAGETVLGGGWNLLAGNHGNQQQQFNPNVASAGGGYGGGLAGQGRQLSPNAQAVFNQIAPQIQNAGSNIV